METIFSIVQVMSRDSVGEKWVSLLPTRGNMDSHGNQIPLGVPAMKTLAWFKKLSATFPAKKFRILHVRNTEISQETIEEESTS